MTAGDDPSSDSLAILDLGDGFGFLGLTGESGGSIYFLYRNDRKIVGCALMLDQRQADEDWPHIKALAETNGELCVGMAPAAMSAWSSWTPRQIGK